MTVERNPFAHLNEDIGEVGQRLFAEYLDLQAIKWEYEAVEGNAKPDFLIHHKSSDAIVKVKTVGWPEEISSDGHYPDQPVRRKIKKAQKQFREYKDKPCALAVHAGCMFGPQDRQSCSRRLLGPA